MHAHIMFSSPDNHDSKRKRRRGCTGTLWSGNLEAAKRAVPATVLADTAPTDWPAGTRVEGTSIR